MGLLKRGKFRNFIHQLKISRQFILSFLRFSLNFLHFKIIRIYFFNKM